MVLKKKKIKKKMSSCFLKFRCSALRKYSPLGVFPILPHYNLELKWIFRGADLEMVAGKEPRVAEIYHCTRGSHQQRFTNRFWTKEVDRLLYGMTLHLQKPSSQPHLGVRSLQPEQHPDNHYRQEHTQRMEER